MKKSELVKFLTENATRVEDFNSNNAWGFGGARGKHYFFPNVVATIAKAGTRHQGEFPYVKAVDETTGEKVDRVPTAKAFDAVANFVQTHTFSGHSMYFGQNKV